MTLKKIPQKIIESLLISNTKTKSKGFISSYLKKLVEFVKNSTVYLSWHSFRSVIEFYLLHGDLIAITMLMIKFHSKNYWNYLSSIWLMPWLKSKTHFKCRESWWKKLATNGTCMRWLQGGSSNCASTFKKNNQFLSSQNNVITWGALILFHPNKEWE